METPLAKAIDIDHGFEKCYILLEGGEGMSIDTSHERFSYSLAKPHKFSDDNIFRRCKNNVKLFSSIVNLNQNIFISHGKFLSIYYMGIEKSYWSGHYEQEADIVQIFRQVTS